MRRNIFALATLAAATSMLPGAHANAVEFSAIFSGFEEIGGLGAGETGAIFSQGKATLDLDLNRSARTIAFTLTYSGLSAPVTQAHIHFRKEHVAGGILEVFWLDLANSPPGIRPSPPPTAMGKGITPARKYFGPNDHEINPAPYAH